MSGRSRDLTGEVSRINRGAAFPLILTMMAGIGVALGGSSAWAQSVILDAGFLVVEDASEAMRVAMGPEVIFEGGEYRVLGPGPNLQTLIDMAAVDAGAGKPYRIVLGPGVYTLSSGLVMQPFVSLAGSGREATFIEAGAAIENLVTGADDMSITDLTIENDGGSDTAVAIWNSGRSPRIQRVTVSAVGTSTAYGVNNSGSSATMIDVAATASAGVSSYGVRNSGSSLTVMKDVMAVGSGPVGAGGMTSSGGVYNLQSSPSMNRIIATGSGGTASYGVRNQTSSSPSMTDVTATASGENLSYGIQNESSSPTMSRIRATAVGGNQSYGVYNISSSPQMTNVIATGQGGASNSRGVWNQNSSPTMTGVVAEGLGSAGSISVNGIFNSGSSSPSIEDSVIKAEGGTFTTGLNGIDATTRIYGTVVIGGIENDDAGTQCLNVFDDTPAPIGC